MRLLVTGADGQLGSELVDAAAEAGHQVRGVNRATCDITDPAGVRDALEESGAEVLVNCAAWTAVDAAESDVDGAFRVNAFGPRVLAGACADLGVLLVHISTDYVFGGGADTPIDEWHAVNPRSAYGASKLAGEEEVRTLCRRHQVVRTSWLYGRDGPNFVLTMLRAAGAGRPLRVVSDQVGSPTWTGHLAPSLLRLIARDLPGTYHLSNSGAVSWHGLAEAVVAAAGLDVPVTPISTTEYPTPAERPRYSVLDNRAWRMLGEAPLPPWRDGVDAYVASRREPAATRD